MGMVMYRGTWHFEPDMGPSNLPDPIIFNMSLDSAAFAYDEEYFPHVINGAYTVDIENDHLFLSYIDGINLYNGDGDFLWNYEFKRDESQEKEFNFWKLSDTELTDYVSNLLFEEFNLVNTNPFYPIELNKLENDVFWFGFVYEEGDIYRYAWLNAMTGEIELTDEVENYTGEE